MPGYLYILRSSKSGRYYTGCTTDPDHRLLQHNANAVAATRSKGPWERVFLLAFDSPTTARQAEVYLKRQKSRRLLELLIAGEFVWPANLKPLTA